LFVHIGVLQREELVVSVVYTVRKVPTGNELVDLAVSGWSKGYLEQAHEGWEIMAEVLVTSFLSSTVLMYCSYVLCLCTAPNSPMKGGRSWRTHW
jgi:hypothetical protein